MTRAFKFFCVKYDAIGLLSSLCCLVHCMGLPWLLSFGHVTFFGIESESVMEIVLEGTLLCISIFAVGRSYRRERSTFLKGVFLAGASFFVIGFLVSHRFSFFIFLMHLGSIVLVMAHTLRLIGCRCRSGRSV